MSNPAGASDLTHGRVLGQDLSAVGKVPLVHLGRQRAGGRGADQGGARRGHRHMGLGYPGECRGGKRGMRGQRPCRDMGHPDLLRLTGLLLLLRASRPSNPCQVGSRVVRARGRCSGGRSRDAGEGRWPVHRRAPDAIAHGGRIAAAAVHGICIVVCNLRVGCHLQERRQVRSGAVRCVATGEGTSDLPEDG